MKRARLYSPEKSHQFGDEFPVGNQTADQELSSSYSDRGGKLGSNDVFSGLRPRPSSNFPIIPIKARTTLSQDVVSSIKTNIIKSSGLFSSEGRSKSCPNFTIYDNLNVNEYCSICVTSQPNQFGQLKQSRLYSLFKSGYHKSDFTPDFRKCNNSISSSKNNAGSSIANCSSIPTNIRPEDLPNRRIPTIKCKLCINDQSTTSVFPKSENSNIIVNNLQPTMTSDLNAHFELAPAFHVSLPMPKYNSHTNKCPEMGNDNGHKIIPSKNMVWEISPKNNTLSKIVKAVSALDFFKYQCPVNSSPYHHQYCHEMAVNAKNGDEPIRFFHQSRCRTDHKVQSAGQTNTIYNHNYMLSYNCPGVFGLGLCVDGHKPELESEFDIAMANDTASYSYSTPVRTLQLEGDNVHQVDIDLDAAVANYHRCDTHLEAFAADERIVGKDNLSRHYCNEYDDCGDFTDEEIIDLDAQMDEATEHALAARRPSNPVAQLLELGDNDVSFAPFYFIH